MWRAVKQQNHGRSIIFLSLPRSLEASTSLIQGTLSSKSSLLNHAISHLITSLVTSQQHKLSTKDHESQISYSSSIYESSYLIICSFMLILMLCRSSQMS
ncbi:hypothetical protein BDZ45DRAFT_86198 [Acephala macrosclerotiorum]|nr:hypothetical protein BDZ45DRAFT_86198 [Acephala macrosclerotiorum]